MIPAFEDARIAFQAAVRTAIELALEWNATQGPNERQPAEVTAEVVGRIGREYQRLYRAREDEDARERACTKPDVNHRLVKE